MRIATCMLALLLAFSVMVGLGGCGRTTEEEGGIRGVMPGMDVDKKVYVENIGGVEFYTRIKLEKSIESNSGKTLNFNNIVLNIDTKNWTKKDDYYYYNEVVKPGAETKPLFTHVSFDEDLGNDYQNARVAIEVIAQSVQSKNNGTSAVTAKGWPEE